MNLKHEHNVPDTNEHNRFTPLTCYDARKKLYYYFVIVWTKFNGEKISTSIASNCCNYAKQETIRDAKELGWTPPKWWQWWRRNDTRIDNHNERGEQ